MPRVAFAVGRRRVRVQVRRRHDAPTAVLGPDRQHYTPCVFVRVKITAAVTAKRAAQGFQGGCSCSLRDRAAAPVFQGILQRTCARRYVLTSRMIGALGPMTSFCSHTHTHTHTYTHAHIHSIPAILLDTYHCSVLCSSCVANVLQMCC
jgi:hypothetical protein